MMPRDAVDHDAWTGTDDAHLLCPVCGRETCEDHLPPDATRLEREQRIAQAAEAERVRREARRRVDAEDRGPIIAPEMITLAALRQEPDPPIAWRLDGWQPAETRVVVAAARKTGKTTLVTSLVRSLVDGDPWLGQSRAWPIDGCVAILDTEMGRRQLRGWYRDACIQDEHRVVLVPLRGHSARLDLQNPACRAAWANWLRGLDARYLVVDCLRPVLDAVGLDESREAGLWLTALDALLVEAAIPEACVVHHMGHLGPTGAERSRGDSRIRDWPDVEWRLVRQEDADDGSPRYISAYGRDVEIPESRLAYDSLTRRLSIAGGSRQAVRAEQALSAIVEAVTAADEPLSGRQLENALADSDHTRSSIRAALALGVRERRLSAADGPRNSRLYRTPAMRPAAAEGTR